MNEYNYDSDIPVKGIGIDITTISRFENMETDIRERFAKRILSESEYDRYLQSKNKCRFLAVSFCAKEAVSKAFGTGMNGIFFPDIILRKNELDRPFILLTEKGNELAIQKDIKQIKISVTHNLDIVIVTAITA